MKPPEQIEREARDLPARIRRILIEPAESAIATVERILADSYYPAPVAAFAREELAALREDIYRQINGNVIARLGDQLERFERRLRQMSQQAGAR